MTESGRPARNATERKTRLTTIRVDEQGLESRARPTAIALAVYTLRAMEIWKRYVPDYDCAMIMVAVIAITAEKLLRTDFPEEYGRLTQQIDLSMLQKCNISSIAHATGLNRETTRRKVNALIQLDRLQRLGDGTIFFRDRLTQEPEVREMVGRQLLEVAALAERCVRLGVLDVRASTDGDGPRGRRPRPAD